MWLFPFREVAEMLLPWVSRCDMITKNTLALWLISQMTLLRDGFTSYHKNFIDTATNENKCCYIFSS